MNISSLLRSQLRLVQVTAVRNVRWWTCTQSQVPFPSTCSRSPSVTGQSSGLPTLYLQSHRCYMRKKTKKIPPTKLLHFDYSGDVEKTLPVYDPLSPRLGFEEVEQLQSAEETVQKIFSMGFADSHELRNKRIQDIISVVQDHPADIQSLEVNIARQTVLIRTQIKHCLQFRKDKVGKAMLVERIHARRKNLMKLRKTDAEKFAWLCKELKIEFILQPLYNHKDSKKALRKRAARDEALAMKKAKLEAFRDQLEAEKETFLVEKEQELDKIEKELSDMGIDKTTSLVKTLKALKMGHIIEEHKARKTRRQILLEMKFELYKDRRHLNDPQP